MRQRYGVTALVAAVGLLLAGAALAQQSGTATSAANADQEFITKAAQGGMMEVKLGQLAEQRAADPAVKQFGRRMVRDHSKANSQLKKAASRENVPVPTTLDEKQQSMVDDLSKLSGAEFDKAYMAHMVQDHEEDVNMFAQEAHDAKTPAVRSFASKTLPTLKKHLSLARSAAKKVGATAAAG